MSFRLKRSVMEKSHQLLYGLDLSTAVEVTGRASVNDIGLDFSTAVEVTEYFSRNDITLFYQNDRL